MSALSPIVLCIAGSDPSGGAGLQADIKTCAAHGAHALTAVTALTVQNTAGVRAVHAVAPARVRDQIVALLDDFDVAAIKIGMLGSAGVARAVVQVLERHAGIPLVLDPVLRASRGAALLDRRGLDVLRRGLLPLASVVTPNLPEAQALIGTPVREMSDMVPAARALLGLGAGAVLIKGGHLEGVRTLVDVFVDDAGVRRFRHARRAIEAHGTGCALSTAFAVGLARGVPAADAARDAIAYVAGALRHSRRRGAGPLVLLDHSWRSAR